MDTIFDELKWQHFQKKRKEMTLDGLKSGLIFPYSDKLIEKFRKIYYKTLYINFNISNKMDQIFIFQ